MVHTVPIPAITVLVDARPAMLTPIEARPAAVHTQNFLLFNFFLCHSPFKGKSLNFFFISSMTPLAPRL